MLATWNIVGAGEPQISCTVRSSTDYEACSKDEEHFKRYLPISCDSPLCPVCYSRLVRRDAKRAEDALRQLHDAYLKSGLDLGMPIHLVISPPTGTPFTSLSEFIKLRSQVYTYAQEIGMVGGCVVFHHTRGTAKQYKALHAGFIDTEDLEIGPHFHLVGFMPLGHKIKSNEFNNKTKNKNELIPSGRNGGYKTGWMYKTIPFRVPKFKTVYNVVKYELSHASVTEGKHMITWFGLCAYNNRHVEVKTESIEAVCKTCGAPIAYYHDEGVFNCYKNIKKEYRIYSIPLTIVNRLAAKYSLPMTPARSENLLAYAI